MTSLRHVWHPAGGSRCVLDLALFPLGLKAEQMPSKKVPDILLLGICVRPHETIHPLPLGPSIFLNKIQEWEA